MYFGLFFVFKVFIIWIYVKKILIKVKNLLNWVGVTLKRLFKSERVWEENRVLGNFNYSNFRF